MPITSTSIVHHAFEFTTEDFESRKAWPKTWPISKKTDWKGEYASQSPLNAMYIATKGGGAEGTEKYLALPGVNSEQFYAEATPRWCRPRISLDLRNTRASVYLKEIKSIKVSRGFEPRLFIADYREKSHTYCGWYLTKPLRLGKKWTFNEIDLVNDERLWTRYALNRSLDEVLSKTGFIGIMYMRGIAYQGVNANGILGIDEFKYNIPFGKG